MKMSRLFCWAVTLAAGSLFSATSNAAILMDPATNNGSFEAPLDGSESGGNFSNNGNGNAGLDGGFRYSSNGGTIVIPGWTIQHNSGFAGVNHRSSTQADDGNNMIVKNDDSLTGTSDPISFDLADGDQFTISGAFEWRAGDAGAYSLSLVFDDGSMTTFDAANAVSFTTAVSTNGTVAYQEQVSETFTYTGAATSVQVLFELAGGGQHLADDFVLTQAVPEPSTIALTGLALAASMVLVRKRK